MHDSSINIKRVKTKSFTSVYNIFSANSFKHIYYLRSEEGNNITVYEANCNIGKMYPNKNGSVLVNETPYITSENYYTLNRNSSEKCIIRSTSTLFYDLDSIVKRHSYHCIPEFPISNTKFIERPSNKNGFTAKSEAIVQECATQIHPNLKMTDSLQIAAKKIKKNCAKEPLLSSEIFLRDNDYTNRKSNSFMKQKDDLKQKFWSYAKYRTEYTNPITEERKYKKKDRGKRTEDPCPCQLFSYACPCTDKKSLTELAKNSKCLSIADQNTSTTTFLPDEGQGHSQKHIKTKKSKGSSYENKLTTTNVTGFSNKYELTAVYEEPVSPITAKKDIPKLIDDKRQSILSCVKNSIKTDSKSPKKSKQIICPNCKEKLEILSITEDEDSLKSKKSPLYRSNEITSPQVNTNNKNNVVDDIDICNHEPPCELVPVCQILPTDNVYINSKCVRRVSLTKHNPKMIKITKPCRHHPPCIVVPSCQRMNVLKNNCEYIPPCLHRPRCVNVPLCVPFSKNLNYDDLVNKQIDDTDNTEFTYISPCKHMSTYQQDSLNNCLDHQFHAAQNTCEYVSEYSPRFILNPKMPYVTPTFSPCQVPVQLACKCCKSNKSCQYDCVDCKSILHTKVKQSISNDAVVYIRDVGCQFRSKNFSPKESLLHSSSASFDITSTKAGNYFSNYHTLRYEDKYTNPVSGEELSMSTFTTSSLDIDVNCPSHGREASRKRNIGFSPNSTASPFVAAFSTYTDPILQYLPMSYDLRRETSKAGSVDTRTYSNAFPTKSRKSNIKGKQKKVFSIRQRRKSRRNNNFSSRRISFNKKIT